MGEPVETTYGGRLQFRLQGGLQAFLRLCSGEQRPRPGCLRDGVDVVGPHRLIPLNLIWNKSQWPLCTM